MDSKTMNKAEIKALIDYMHLITDQVPRGLSHLEEALTFAIMDLTMYHSYGRRGKDFEKALAFGQSIPSFDDFGNDEFNHWLINDQEHLKYLP